MKFRTPNYSFNPALRGHGVNSAVNWVRDEFLPAKSREIPAVRRLNKYTAKEAIIDALCKETNKSFDEGKGMAKEWGQIFQNDNNLQR